MKKLHTEKITAVIPTYNEAYNLPQTISQLFGLNLPNFNILVIDDNSPDNTADIARRLSNKYNKRIEVIVRPQKSGLGTAYREGFQYAVDQGSKVIIQLDADLSHPISEIPSMLDKISLADVVVGSRYIHSFWNFKPESGWPLHRRLLSSFGNLSIRLVSGLAINDSTSGFKVIKHNVLTNIDLEKFRCKGFGFQAEMAFKCQSKGYKTVEHPIEFVNRKKGYSKMNPMIVVESIWVLFYLRLNQLTRSSFNLNLKNRTLSD